MPLIASAPSDALKLSQSRLSPASGPLLVNWDDEHDAANPQNWSSGRKWGATLAVSAFSVIAPISSSMVAPCLVAMSHDFDVTSSLVTQMMLSIFVLAWGFGPLLLGPLSEAYGRVVILQSSNVIYVIFNLACGFARSPVQMIIFRLFAGLGGSAPLAVGDGVLGDIWPADELGKAIAIYSLAPLLGPSIGPIIGGFVVSNTTWRWTFYATSIAAAVCTLGGFVCLQETYAPYLLSRKARQLRLSTGDNAYISQYEELRKDEPFALRLRTHLVRPLKLLATQPIIQVLALYMAVLYGILYLVLSTFANMWTEIYHESPAIASLNYISLAAGLSVGTQIGAPFNDKIYRRMRQGNHGMGLPEFRLPLMMPACIMITAGILWYGWSCSTRVHWILPNLGTALFTAGVIIAFQCVQTYVIAAYPRYAASAMSSIALLRAVAGFSFPLFAEYLYADLGYGWGSTLLALLALVIGFPMSVGLWLYGGRLRARSPFAAGQLIRT